MSLLFLDFPWYQRYLKSVCIYIPHSSFQDIRLTKIPGLWYEEKPMLVLVRFLGKDYRSQIRGWQLFSSSVISYSATPWTSACQATCVSLSPRVCSNSCPLSWSCHPTISSSVIPFCSCPKSYIASGSFPMSWLFASCGLSIGASASASVLPMKF